MLIGTPMAIDEIVKGIPKGELMTAGKLRAIMADKFDADYACPMTTGIFLRIAAEYANEQMNNGVKNVTPFWRVIRDDGSLIDKLPGGIEHQAELLAKEGFTFVPKGKSNVRVEAFENYI
jgi:alkylated DNA nucleotide flippase Atl1